MNIVAADGRPQVAVVGAGIVGACAALALQREGMQVTIYDPLPPGSGASFGNAGLISIDSCVPISMPGMLRQVPRWLLDSSGPLSLAPRHAVRAAPWLLRWLRAGRLSQVRASAAALHALHRQSLDEYRRLLGASVVDGLVHLRGQLHVWEGDAGRSDRLADELRRRLSVPTQPLSGDEVRELVPQLSHRVRRGLLFPRHGHVADPQGLVQALVVALQRAGGTVAHERVLKVVPRFDQRSRLLTNVGDRTFDRVVVAAGVWSRELLEPLGVQIPLASERGYHMHLSRPSIELQIPVVHKDRGFALTSTAGGLRVAGTVEIAALADPPDERRADLLLRHAMALFPALEFETRTAWMGQRPSTPDSLPIIDRLPRHPGIFIACGHGHFGMTAASSTARVLSRLMTGQTPEIDSRPYRLERF